MQKTSDRIYRYILERAPNAVLEDALILDLTTPEISGSDVNNTLQSMKAEGIITNEPLKANLEVYKEQIARQAVYLTDYPRHLQIKKEISVAGRRIPRLLDGDTARAEDTNRSIEVLASLSETLKEDAKEIVKEETRPIYSQMIAIFGIFVSIFAVVVISADKLIQFDPNALVSVSRSELFIRVSIAMSPAALMIAALLIVLVLFRKM